MAKGSLKGIIESLGEDYAEYLKIYRKLWNRLYRKPFKRSPNHKANDRRYYHAHKIERNRNAAAGKKLWKRRNVERCQGYKIKSLGDKPLWHAFVELDRHPPRLREERNHEFPFPA